MVVTNQGMAIQPCFQQAKYRQFYKIGQWVVFIKTRTKHASKCGIELAVFKAFWEVLIEVLSFGFGSRNWSSFACSQYCSSTGPPSFTP